MSLSSGMSPSLRNWRGGEGGRVEDGMRGCDEESLEGASFWSTGKVSTLPACELQVKQFSRISVYKYHARVG